MTALRLALLGALTIAALALPAGTAGATTLVCVGSIDGGQGNTCVDTGQIPVVKKIVP